MINTGVLKLGEKTQLHSSKSLLGTVELGSVNVIQKTQIEKQAAPIIVNIEQKVNDELDYVKNLDSVLIEPVKINPPEKEYIIDDSYITTIKVGSQHNDKPISSIICLPQKNDGSIIEDIDTGFGECGKVEIECPKPEYKTPLYKENYLGEFKETEKELIRNNLGVYSKPEVEKIVNQLIANDSTSFITKEYFDSKIAELDFVNSELKAQAEYTIPNNLFTL